MKNFMTASDKVRRLAQQKSEARERACEQIDQLIKEAPRIPVVIPLKMFTDDEAVREELLRKLKDESGWHVSVDEAAGEVTLKTRL